MRMRNGLLAGALVGAAVAGALVAVWFLAGWWILLWAPLLILLVLLGGVTVAAEKSRPAPRGGVSSAEPGGTAGFAPEPRWELDPVVRREVASVELPSAERDYTFLFSATVCRTGGESTEEHRNPDALAADDVVRRAREYAEDCDPAEHTLVGPRLAALLGEPVSDHRTGVRVWAENVAVSLREEDAERLRRLSAMRKERDVWQQEKEVERTRRAYLGDDVLATPGRALVWWLSQEAGEDRQAARMRAAAELVDTFARISAVATGKDVTPPQWSAAETGRASGAETAEEPTLFERLCGFLDGLAERDAFVDRFVKLLSHHGQEEWAERLRERYLSFLDDGVEPPTADEGGEPAPPAPSGRSGAEPGEEHSRPFTDEDGATPGPAAG